MPPVVAAADLSKVYDGVVALRDVTLEIDHGEIFALIGPNGAGKTTFVRAITGTITPTAGEISVFGTSPRAVDYSRVGLLPQAFSPPGRLTGREIIEYYAGLYDTARATDDVLSDVGMVEDADRWFERLSGGQRRRICVGTALVNDPEFLILDEPTTGIDPGGRRQLWSLFRGLQATGRTILLTTHDMAEAAELGDRVGLLSDGQLVEVGRPTALIARHGGLGRIIVEPTDAVSTTADQFLDHPVTIEDGLLVIDEVASGDVGPIIRMLDNEEIVYRRITWEEPTLEDVFFELTDREVLV